MVTEDYVSFETAKLLKEKGFKEWCSQCYGLDVRHSGEPIDFDEEYELKAAGKENEIEYVDGGRMYNYGCGNFNPGSPYAAPSLYVAMKWLRKVHHIDIEVRTHYLNRLKPNDIRYYSGKILKGSEDVIHTVYSKDTYEEVCEEAIKYCLKNLI